MFIIPVINWLKIFSLSSHFLYLNSIFQADGPICMIVSMIVMNKLRGFQYLSDQKTIGMGAYFLYIFLRNIAYHSFPLWSADTCSESGS